MKKLNYFFLISLAILLPFIIEGNPFSFKFYENGFRKLTNLFFQENTSLREEYRKQNWARSQKSKSCLSLYYRSNKQGNKNQLGPPGSLGLIVQENSFSVYDIPFDYEESKPNSNCSEIGTYKFNKTYSIKKFYGDDSLRVEFYKECYSEDCLNALNIYGLVKYPYGTIKRIDFFSLSNGYFISLPGHDSGAYYDEFRALFEGRL